MQDEIERPGHYQFGQLEAWDVIELAIEGIRDPVTAYHTASALKYLLRAARKGGDTDVAKANAHLKREIARHLPKSPDYAPASVAFRHGDLAKVCGIGDVPHSVKQHRVVVGHRAERSEISFAQSGVNANVIAHSEGASDYGNPITPGCAVRQSDSWRVSYGGGRS